MSAHSRPGKAAGSQPGNGFEADKIQIRECRDLARDGVVDFTRGVGLVGLDGLHGALASNASLMDLCAEAGAWRTSRMGIFEELLGQGSVAFALVSGRLDEAVTVLVRHRGSTRR